MKISFTDEKEQIRQVEYTNCREKIVIDGQQIEKTVNTLLLILESNRANRNLISLINRIKYSDLLETTTMVMPSPPIKIDGEECACRYVNFYKNLKEFSLLKQELSEYNFTKNTFAYQCATDEEIQKWVKQQIEIRKEYPQIDMILEQLKK